MTPPRARWFKRLPPRGRSLFVLGALLPALLGAGGEAPSSPRAPANLRAWWKQDNLCQELGVTASQRQQLATELDNLQTSYQLAQTRLNDARKRQTAMMFDPTIDAAALAAFHRAEVQTNSDQMQELNFQARVVVRSRLTKEQLAALAKSHPQFFSARWFRTSPVPVREGQVVIEDE